MNAIELLLRSDIETDAIWPKPDSAKVLVRFRTYRRDENPSPVVTLTDNEILVGTDHPHLTDDFVKLSNDIGVADTLGPSQQRAGTTISLERPKHLLALPFTPPIYRAQANSESAYRHSVHEVGLD